MTRVLVRQVLVGLVLSTALAGVASADPVHDAVADFSLSGNPNGAWSYGRTTTLGGAFTLHAFTQVNVLGGLDAWSSFIAGDGNPQAIFNNTGVGQTFGTTVFFPADELVLHPGPNGEFSVVRWTAPTAGISIVSASFVARALDGAGTTTDVHILKNGVSIYDSLVSGFNGSAAAGAFPDTAVLLAAGDTIDFVVGVGPNGTFFSDSTGLKAQITAVPEPTTLAMLGLSALALAWRRRRNST